jgi:hypothetical protein
MTTTTEGAGVTFHLERFEVHGDRLEVEGRWFGVRGLRFVRPSLIIHAGHVRRSLLALLEHKPWAAEDGRPWTAVFPWDGGSADPKQAELAVAPSVVVALEPSGRRPPTPHEALAAEKRKVARLEAEVAWLRQQHADFDQRLARAIAERDRAVADRDAIAEKTEGDRVAAAEARSTLTAERDDARREREAVARERDDALRERDAARADRLPALAQSRAAEAHRDAALRELQRAIALRDEAKRERDAALARSARAEADRDEAVRDRDAARRDREVALRERDAAVRARSAALAERDSARAHTATLTERDASRAHTAALAERDAARARTAALAERDAARALALGERSESRGGPDATLVKMDRRPRSPIQPLGSRPHWGARVLAVAAFLALVAAVIVLTRVL